MSFIDLWLSFQSYIESPRNEMCGAQYALSDGAQFVFLSGYASEKKMGITFLDLLKKTK